MLKSQGAATRFNILLAVIFVAFIYILVKTPKESRIVIERREVQTETAPESRDVDSSHTKNFDQSFQRMVDHYSRQVAQRRRYLQDIKERRLEEKYAKLYNNLVPEVFCPLLVRVGETNDGGKWMCNPFQIPTDSVVFSLGMNGDISFESELQNITAKCCYIYAYDVAEQSKGVKSRLKEMRGSSRVAKISHKVDEQNKEFTIEHLMEQEDVQSIEILKVDIEGSELEALPPFLKKHHPAQIMVEIHSSAYVMTELVQDIAKEGYWLFSHEINGAHHNLCEFSFIHVSAFERYSVTALARYLD